MAGQARAEGPRPLGFWAAWALSVGVMIGSGIFSLPAVLAPYGGLAFGGWLIAALGSMLLALTIAGLAASARATGGPYVYARAAFGDSAGFLVAWSHWISYATAIPAIAVAFAGYLPVFFPALTDNPFGQSLSGLALIWALTVVNLRGVQESARVQIVMALVKIAPLVVIIVLGVVSGEAANFPSANPQARDIAPALAATALLTMWAFTGLEAGAVPAGVVKNAEKAIPRAVVAATVFVAGLYIAATAAVMALVPSDELAMSTAPFADAARALGPAGPAFVAAGALAATAGALNGVIFIVGQLPAAAAIDRLAPGAFSRLNRRGAPAPALYLGAALGSALLLANYSRGLVAAFELLLTMSTLTVLLPYLACAAARLAPAAGARGAALVAAGLAAGFCVFAIVGAGLETILWGALLLLAGLPVYYLARKSNAAPA